MPKKRSNRPLIGVAPIDLPAAEDMRRFAHECRRLAARSDDPAEQRLFKGMASGWLAVAAQVERTDALLVKIHALGCAALN